MDLDQLVTLGRIAKLLTQAWSWMVRFCLVLQRLRDIPIYLSKHDISIYYTLKKHHDNPIPPIVNTSYMVPMGGPPCQAWNTEKGFGFAHVSCCVVGVRWLADPLMAGLFLVP